MPPFAISTLHHIFILPSQTLGGIGEVVIFCWNWGEIRPDFCIWFIFTALGELSTGRAKIVDKKLGFCLVGSERCVRRLPTRWGVITTMLWIRLNRWIFKIVEKNLTLIVSQLDKSVPATRTYYVAGIFLWLSVPLHRRKLGTTSRRCSLTLWNRQLEQTFKSDIMRNTAKSKHLSTRVEEGAGKSIRMETELN